MMCILDRLEGRWLQKGNACARGGEESPYSASGGSDDGHEYLLLLLFCDWFGFLHCLDGGLRVDASDAIECRSHPFQCREPPKIAGNLRQCLGCQSFGDEQPGNEMEK